ncbi:unnamed protein product [Vicia faba]|uniref:Myb/SANT-like domain-containing protein n=1 Tax=Vicia faba TaxID=3906 RepID=A0AAV0Z302_VICFA|nr:unnamed protein product [Vicia faba]
MESEINMRQSIKRKRDYYSPLSRKSDETFLDLLIGALNNDKRCDDDEQFKQYMLKWSMEKMEEDLGEKYPHHKPKLKAYIEWVNERLRTVYGIVCDMKKQSGFGWDDEKKMIKVDSDQVWKEYVKRDPRATYFRNTPIPLFDKLARVFGKNHASGKELGNSSSNVEMIKEEQKDSACGKEPTSTNPSANFEMIDKQEEEQNDHACGKEPANTSANVEMMIDKQEEERNEHPASGHEPANSSVNVEMIDKQEEEQSDHACFKEPAHTSVNVEMIDDKQEEEQSDPASGKEPANPSANVEMIDDKQEEEQNGRANGQDLAHSSANVEVVGKQEEEQNHLTSGKEPANSIANVEMIDKQEEEQRDHASGKEPANSIANVEMIDKQEEEQRDHASGKEPASPSGKELANSSTNVEMIDKQEEEQRDHASGKEPANPSVDVGIIDRQEEEQNDNEEDEVEMTLLTPIKHGCMEGPSKKRNEGENAIADGIFEFEKTIKGLLEKHIEQLGAVVNRLRVDKDIYDDSRKVMNELTEMGLTEQEYFTAADRILSMPHRLHIFWGCNDVKRLAFVKWLIHHS